MSLAEEIKAVLYCKLMIETISGHQSAIGSLNGV